MDALLILGNQLFSASHLPKVDKENTLVFMREDAALCTHFKYHKHKIIFFLSAMRRYAQELKSEGYQVHYETLEEAKGSYSQALAAFIKTNNIETFHYFEIEDKFFEKDLLETVQKFSKMKALQIPSPMFLTSRSRFAEYLKNSKKPFMKTFYEAQRKRLKVLLTPEGEPVGGRWSFDDENRLSLPKDYTPPAIPSYKMDALDLTVARLVDKHFSDHSGESANFWLPTDRKSAH
ncbi:MAG TPA: cryptochrome/photolyase family protein, partial [Bdellovibrio sp.]